MAPDADIRLFLMETMWTIWQETIFTIPMGTTATITGRFVSQADCPETGEEFCKTYLKSIVCQCGSATSKSSGT